MRRLQQGADVVQDGKGLRGVRQRRGVVLSGDVGEAVVDRRKVDVVGHFVGVRFRVHRGCAMVFVGLSASLVWVSSELAGMAGIASVTVIQTD